MRCSRAISSALMFASLIVGHAIADDSSRYETASALAVRFSESGLIDESIRAEIIHALTVIQGSHAELAAARNEAHFEMRTMLLFLEEAEDRTLEQTFAGQVGEDGTVLLETTGIAGLDALNEKYGVAKVELTRTGYLLLRFVDAMNIPRLTEEYERLPGIKLAATDYYNRAMRSDISLEPTGNIWRFVFSVRCEASPAACGYGGYRYHLFDYDRSSREVRKAGEEGVLSRIGCTQSAIKVVEKFDPEEVMSCTTSTYGRGSDEVDIVDIRVGPGMDCESGCIFDGIVAVVDGEDVSAFEGGSDTKSREIRDRFGDACAGAAWSEDALVRTPDGYQWVALYRDARSTDVYGNECALTGHTLHGRGNGEFALTVAYPSISSCSNEVLDAAWAFICRNDSADSCEEDKERRTAAHRGYCLETVARMRADPRLCERLEHPTRRSVCYKNLAVGRLDIDACAFVGDTPYRAREQCVESIQRYRSRSAGTFVPDPDRVLYHRPITARNIDNKWSPRISECDPARLAGFGRFSRASCFDLIFHRVRGPEMVVVAGTQAADDHFAIGKYEISIDDWARYCRIVSLDGELDGRGCDELDAESGHLPVTGVSLDQARRYTAWLSERTGHRYRLPNVTEWQHAARADTNAAAAANGCGSDVAPGSIRSGPANAWGLRNSVGNVQEWVLTESGDVMAAGGHYGGEAVRCTVAGVAPHAGTADPYTGFRVLREFTR